MAPVVPLATSEDAAPTTAASEPVSVSDDARAIMGLSFMVVDQAGRSSTRADHAMLVLATPVTRSRRVLLDRSSVASQLLSLS